jgi:transposase
MAGSIVRSDTFRSYTGIAAKGYVHRLVNHSKGQYADAKGNHINGLEGFWSYAKERLIKHHGVSKEKFPRYLKEIEYRYEGDIHRTLKHDDQLARIGP